MLYPKARFEQLSDISAEYLIKCGIRGIMLDIDNTLCADGASHISAPVQAWVEEMLAHKIALCLLSNSGGARVLKLGEALKLAAISKAGKPSLKGYRSAAEKLGLAPCETAVIGDQIFSDILGGNRFGAYTILVTPIAPGAEPTIVKLKRPFEKFLLYFFQKRSAR